MPRYPLRGVGGITKLSELIIDAQKDWKGFGLHDLAQIALAMQKGDLPVRGDSILQKLSPMTMGYVLTSMGPGHIPTWLPIPGALEEWIAAEIESSHNEAIVTPDKTIDRTALIATSYSHPGPTKQPEISLSVAAAKVTPDKTADKTALPDTLGCLCDAVGGAVADDGGGLNDETAAANDNTADDMTLLPAVPAVNDAYPIGYAATFGAVLLKQSTIGAGVWTIVWDYWNGAWVPLAGVVDETGGFRQGSSDSVLRVSFTIPGDWAQTVILGMNLYWIRPRVSDYTSITTQPLGRRAWIERANV